MSSPTSYKKHCQVMLTLGLLVGAIIPSNADLKSFQLQSIKQLNQPWGMQWWDKNSLLITQKSGEIFRYHRPSHQLQALSHNLNVAVVGQGGLLDISNSSTHIYVSYSSYFKNNPYSNKFTTAIARAPYQIGQAKLHFNTFFRASYPVSSGLHFGSRLLIHNQSLYATIGERGGGDLAQDPRNHIGTIVRLNLDGSAHRDNPFYKGHINWLPEIYQIGVRNPQGLDYLPITNKIYISNHGARGGDFVSPIHFAGNYGWNIIGWGGTDYDGSPIGEGIAWRKPFNKTEHTWTPSIAVSQIQAYQGKAFRHLNNTLLVSSLKGRSLSSLSLNRAGRLTQEKHLWRNRIGRIRDISVHLDDGTIYLLSNSPDTLWHMTPN